MENEVISEKESAPKPPIAGIIYGRTCYWIVMIGIIVAMTGMIMYFTSDGYFNEACLLDNLWEGKDVETIWEECAGVTSMPQGHWYLGLLSYGDVIAMLGIAIISLAAVVGMWGAFIGTVRSGERMFAVFALIIAVILTLSAIGVLKLE
jgi:hypothetical protein